MIASLTRRLPHLIAAALLALASLLAPLPGQAQAVPPTESDLTLDGGMGDGGATLGALHGTLMIPDGWAGGPAVVIQAGSGPTDRDGNSRIPGVHPDTLKLIAQGLATHGIASLRVDKRCIAASAGACPGEDKLRFTTYVDDMAAWARLITKQPKVGCVLLLGHSEGATIATLAAAKLAVDKAPVCGVLSLSGSGRPFGQVLIEQMKASGAPPALVEKAASIEASLAGGQTVADVPPPLQAMFRPAVQPYLISMMALDPAKGAGALTVPLLILQGETDLQVSVADARLLAQAQPAATLALIPGANHVLKTAPADRPANLATYADPTLPLAPGVMDAITGFIATAVARH
ncbi:MAG: alpha/beta fold hydrolase [Azospirillaceae bacterium]|nr:alpha/beta fold hydrolase [Azospirillaceae bacterium]